jgi:hypothetical protein
MGARQRLPAPLLGGERRQDLAARRAGEQRLLLVGGPIQRAPELEQQR